MTTRKIDIPECYEVFFQPSRYKVGYGGRARGASWTFARLLTLFASNQRKRILCAREYQNSIEESVHHVIAEQIELLGLAGWNVGKTRIENNIGSEFIFRGIKRDPRQIKSMEGVDYCWVEEAEAMSNESWDILIPTIRKEQSEIWLSFNPNDETDPTSQRFVVNPPTDTITVFATWRDNPWFPDVLKRERDYMWKTDPDRARHIWDGEYRAQTQAQVFGGKWVKQAFTPGEDWSGPYFGADWGFSQDPTALIRFWVHERRLYIEHEAYGVGVDIDETPQLFRSVPEAETHVIRADSARPETISHMQRQGFRIVGAKKWTGCVEDGVAFLRSFEQIVIHPRCTHAVDEFKHYSYKVDKLSGDVLPVLMDAWNHIIDALRYGAETLMRPTRMIEAY